MIIDSKKICGKKLTWVLRCPSMGDAVELSEIRAKIDGETENLDRETGEGVLTPKAFETIISEDSVAERSLFLVADVNGKIVGFTRCIGNQLNRFLHKAEFGICILKDYWGYGIGNAMLEQILSWAESAGIRKISLTVVQTNVIAIQLYKKYGFVEEGLLINDRIHKDGKYYNTVLMGRMLEE